MSKSSKSLNKNNPALGKKQLQLALDAAKGAVFYYDLINDRVTWDDANLNLFGFRREEFGNTRADWEKRIHPDDLPNAVTAMDDAFSDKNNDYLDIEFRIILPDSEIRYINARAWIDRDADGTPVVISGIHFDITEQKLAKIRLKASEEKFRMLYESLSDAVFLIEKDRRFVCNTAACEMFGYTAEEMKPFHMRDLAPIEELGKEEIENLENEIYEKTLQYGKYKFEWVHKRKNGELFDVEVVSSFVKIDDKNLLQCIVREISDRKKMEKDLRNSQDDLQRAQELAKVGHWRYDINTETFSGSKEAQKHYQLKSATSTLKEISEKIDPEYRAMVYQQFYECVNNGKSFNHDFQILLKDGSKMWINSVAFPELDENGNVDHVLGTSMDISERKENELALDEHYQFEHIINRLSSNLVETRNLDEKIENILASIGEYANVDRAYVYLVSNDGTLIKNSHVWYSKSSKLRDKLELTLEPEKQVPWFWSLIKAGKTVHVPSIKDLTEEAKNEKKLWVAKEFKAFLGLPMINNNRLIGFLGFVDEKKEKTWSDNVIALMRITGETFARAIEQKRMYDSLRQSEERFRRLIKDSPVAMVVSDSNMKVIDINEQFVNLTGYSKKEISHEQAWWDKLVPNPQYRLHIIQWWNKVVNDAIDKEQSITEPIEVVFTCKDGKKRDIMINMAFTGDLKLMVLQDYTKQRQGEELLQAQRDLAIALGHCVGLEETLKVCTEAAINASFMDCGGVYLTNPLTNSIHLKYHTGLSKAFSDSVMYLDCDRPDVKYFLDSKPIYAHSSELISKDDAIVKSEGLKATAIIPINYKNQVIGCMNVASHVLDNVPEYSKLILETIAGQIGQAIMRERALDKQREREENLFTFFESVDDFLFVIDERASIIQFNSSVTKKLGYREADLVGESILTIHPVKQRQRVAKVITEIRNQKRFAYDIPIISKDGKVIPVESLVTVGKWNGRKAYFCVTRDITQRKQAEEALKRTSSFLQTVIDQAPFGIEICEGHFENWKFTMINKEAQRILGTSAEQHRGFGRKDGVFINPENFTWKFKNTDGSECHDSELPLNITLEKGKAVLYKEFIILNSSGIETTVLINAAPIFDDQQQIIGGVVTFADISVRKKVEKDLLDSRERLAKAEEIAHMGSWEIDYKTGKNKWSDEFYRICGYEPSEIEMTDEKSLEITHPDDRQKVINAKGNAREKGEKYDVEKRIIRPDGSIRFVHSIGKVITDKNNKPEKIVGSFLDITERVLAEQEAISLERQIQETQKHESLGVLAGGIAHNFNNVLLAVLGNLELSSNSLSKEHIAFKTLENAMRAAKRAVELSRLMLVYVGQGQEQFENIYLSSLIIENCIKYKAGLADNVKIECSNLMNSDYSIRGSKTMIIEFLQNLITNAVESFDEKEGEIQIKIIDKELTEKKLGKSHIIEKPAPGLYVCLSVSDNGCGMNKEIKSRMFEPYFSTKFTGRGLGLAAVLGIIRGHGGAVFVKSKEGTGTIVEAAFPVFEEKM